MESQPRYRWMRIGISLDAGRDFAVAVAMGNYCRGTGKSPAFTTNTIWGVQFGDRKVASGSGFIGPRGRRPEGRGCMRRAKGAGERPGRGRWRAIFAFPTGAFPPHFFGMSPTKRLLRCTAQARRRPVNGVLLPCMCRSGHAGSRERRQKPDPKPAGLGAAMPHCRG